MQYIYVLDYSTPSRLIIKVDDNINVEEKIDDILSVHHLKVSECSWLVTDRSLYDNVMPGIITKSIIK